MASKDPTSRRWRPLKVAGIAVATIAGVAALTLIGINVFVRVAYAPFYERAHATFPIPGVTDGFVPQDLDRLDETDSWLFSGYMADDSPSPLYRRDANGTVSRLAIVLPDGTSYWGHGSAVTSTDDYVLLAREGGYLVLDAYDVAYAQDGATLQTIGSVNLDFSPAFMNIEEGTLYAGNFFFPEDYETPEHHHITTGDGTENPAIMYAYPPSDEGRYGFAPQAARVYSIPAKVQGVAVNAQGKLMLSTSYGLSSSQLLVYDLASAAAEGTFEADGASAPLYALDGRSLVESLAAPPMTEGVESHDGLVYIAEESASNKYLFGKLYGAGMVYALAL